MNVRGDFPGSAQNYYSEFSDAFSHPHLKLPSKTSTRALLFHSSTTKAIMITHRTKNERSTINTEGTTMSPQLSPVSPRSTIPDSPHSPLRRAKSLPDSLQKSDNGKPLFWFRPPKEKRSTRTPRSHRRSLTFPHLPFRPPRGKSSSGFNDLTVPDLNEPAKGLHIPDLHEQPSRCTEATVSITPAITEDNFSVSSVEEDMNEISLRGLSFIEDEVRE